MSWKIDRRDFMTLMGTAVAAGIGLPRTLLAISKPRSSLFGWTTINPQLHVAIGTGGNSLVIKGPEGSALVDSKVLGLGPSILEQSSAIAEGPIQYLFNTHHHGDHTGGNHAFVDSQCIAQSNLSPRIVDGSREALEGVEDPEEWVNSIEESWEMEMEDSDRAELLEFAETVSGLDPESFAPDQTFERRLQHTDTGIELNWRHIGPGHTDNDAYLFIPEHNVLHAGDLLFFGTHPFMRASDGGNTVGWQRALAAAIAICDDETVVIPGHGAITDKTGLRAQSQYFDRLRELVITAMEERTTRELVQEIDPPEFRDLNWKTILPGLLGIIFDELK
jgi:cyclase